MGEGNFWPPTESTHLDWSPKILFSSDYVGNPYGFSKFGANPSTGGFWANGWNIANRMRQYIFVTTAYTQSDPWWISMGLEAESDDMRGCLVVGVDGVVGWFISAFWDVWLAALGHRQDTAVCRLWETGAGIYCRRQPPSVDHCRRRTSTHCSTRQWVTDSTLLLCCCNHFLYYKTTVSAGTPTFEPEDFVGT